MHADFKFHPVGYGLFYSGVINVPELNGMPYAFVYDCGGQNLKNVTKCVNDFWKPFQKRYGESFRLAMLVVSHFHEDHICGVPYLIDMAKPCSVVLPYLYPEEKKLYADSLKLVPSIDQQTLGALRKFISDPKEYCEKHCQGCKVYFIDPEENAAKPRSMSLEENVAGRSFGELHFAVENVGVRDGLSVVKNGAVGRIAHWEFHFYMPRTDLKARIIKRWLSNVGIKLELQNITARVWRNFVARFKNCFGRRQNSSNLICMHGPILGAEAKGRWRAWTGNCNYIHCWIPFCVLRGPVACGDVVDGDFVYDGSWTGHSGFQVLTGDAEFLRSVPAEIADMIKECCFLFHVPHHGSKKNWRDWFVGELTNCKLWIATHQSDCKYKGRDFMTTNLYRVNTCHVTENPNSLLTVRMLMGLHAGMDDAILG